MKKQSSFPGLAPAGIRFLLVFAVLFLAGCQSNSIDNLGVGEPQPLTTPLPPDAATETDVTTPAAYAAPATPIKPTSAEVISEAVPTEAVNSGAYPAAGADVTGEAPQLTKSDTDAIREELQSASEKASKRGGDDDIKSFASELKALRRKAKTHGRKALKKIEKPGG